MMIMKKKLKIHTILNDRKYKIKKNKIKKKKNK